MRFFSAIFYDIFLCERIGRERGRGYPLYSGERSEPPDFFDLYHAKLVLCPKISVLQLGFWPENPLYGILIRPTKTGERSEPAKFLLRISVNPQKSIRVRNF